MCLKTWKFAMKHEQNCLRKWKEARKEELNVTNEEKIRRFWLKKIEKISKHSGQIYNKRWGRKEREKKAPQKFKVQLYLLSDSSKFIKTTLELWVQERERERERESQIKKVASSKAKPIDQWWWPVTQKLTIIFLFSFSFFSILSLDSLWIYFLYQK